jgi:hypothetical protein
MTSNQNSHQLAQERDPKLTEGGLSVPAEKPSFRRDRKVNDLLNERAHARPVWIRSPKAGSEFYSGLSRAKLYELAAEGKIRSVSLRSPGQVKGTRLFLLESILEFIEACEREFTASGLV